MPSIDPMLWTIRSTHSVAGGPVEVVLTEEGRQRAFSVGAQVRRGDPLSAFMALAGQGGVAALVTRVGSQASLTDLGRLHASTWAYLAELGYVERWHGADGDGVRLTDAGRVAVQRGYNEQARLLERSRVAAKAP
jgi:hypothetical protein